MRSNILSVGLALSVCLTSCSWPSRSALDTATIKIVAFNDFHGQLESPDTLKLPGASSNATPVGGVDWMSGYIRRLKKQNPNTLVVSAGDLIGATPLLSALFHDEGTIEAMNRLGLDFNAVGNHEFDAGTDELQRMQNGGCHPTDLEHSCLGAEVSTPVPFEGAHFKFLAANVIEKASGKTLFPAYAVVTIDGIKIGIIGMTLKGTPTVSSAAGSTALKFTDEATTANKLIPALRTQGVESIVLLIHQGGEIPDALSADSINRCSGNLKNSPIRTIVEQLDDAIDLVISGHTHQAYNCMIANRAGRPIPVTSANAKGRILTDIDLDIDRSNGDVIRIKANNIVVDQNNPNITPDEGIQALVSRYRTIAEPFANRIIGTISADFSRTANAAGESALGDLLADSRLNATATGKSNAVAAFINPGAIRADLNYESGPAGEGNGKVIYAEAFAMHPFADRLVTLTLTGAQIHTLLEQQFRGCTEGYPPDAPSEGQSLNRVLQVSKNFSYTWRRKSTPCDYVDPADIKINGVVIEPDSDYRITVNGFLASGGDGFYVLREGRDRTVGPTELDALESYLRDHSNLTPAQQNRIMREPQISVRMLHRDTRTTFQNRPEANDFASKVSIKDEL